MNTATVEAIKQAAHTVTASIRKQDYSLEAKHGGAIHYYTAPDGAITFARLRLKHPDTGEKWIRPLRRDASGDWCELKAPEFEGGTPIYNLHQLCDPARQSERMILVEGEFKVDMLALRGILATTSGGAQSVETADWQPAAGRNVLVWPDNDKPGFEYAQHAADKLKALGCEVAFIDVAALNLPPKGDAVDWLKAFNQQHGRKAAAADVWSLPVIERPPEKNDSAGSATDDPNRGGRGGGSHTPPEPLPELPDVLPFDYSYLPDALRGYVKDISERMQCPPDFAAVGVLVMTAAIIGRKVAMRPKRKDDWTVIPNLWGAVVGNSGVMKSPALAAALSPIKKLQTAAFNVFNTAKAEFDAKGELLKVQQSVNTSQAKSKLKKDAAANVSDLLKSPQGWEPPIQKRYLTNNASYEALGELLMENPNGILVESDEIIGLLKQLDASGQEVARSFYLTAADGDKAYTFDRIVRGKGLHIPALCISIIGGIQPGVLAQYVRQATGGGAGADGLLQRFGLMVYPDIAPGCSYVDRYPDSPAREAVNMVAEKLDNLNPAEIGAEVNLYGGVPFLRFDDTAQAIFAEWIVKLDTRLRSGEEHPAIVSHFSKYRKLVPSLALVNHLCDTGQGAIGEAALLRAIAFSEYLESHAKRIYSYATRLEIEGAKTLLKRLESGKLPDVFKTRDIYQKGWTGLENSSKAQSAINLLLEYHHLREEEITTGGRPTTYYHWIKVAF